MDPIVIHEQIKICAKQLKLPTFCSYQDVLRQAEQNADFALGRQTQKVGRDHQEFDGRP
ncbi:MAG: hypothetical protein IJU76_08260 [Desulfovibrionaceae bacterium]|nr:hypothetical protein [Desulfovibrionaceae bacterium]